MQGGLNVWNQINIFGEKLEVPSDEKLKEVCCEACYTATEPECTCKCHGAYHGLGNLNNQRKQRKKEA